MYLKINRCFQKLNRKTIARIQLAKNAGSLSRNARHTMCRASMIKIFGPMSRLNPKIRASHNEHFAKSLKVSPFSIEEFNLNKALRPEQLSINSTQSLWYQYITLTVKVESSKR